MDSPTQAVRWRDDDCSGNLALQYMRDGARRFGGNAARTTAGLVPSDGLSLAQCGAGGIAGLGAHCAVGVDDIQHESGQQDHRHETSAAGQHHRKIIDRRRAGTPPSHRAPSRLADTLASRQPSGLSCPVGTPLIPTEGSTEAAGPSNRATLLFGQHRVRGDALATDELPGFWTILCADCLLPL